MIHQLGRRTFNVDGKIAIGRLLGGKNVRSNQFRHHHPNPFDPKTTKGWKAALKVRVHL
jgi:hypothetical protein